MTLRAQWHHRPKLCAGKVLWLRNGRSLKNGGSELAARPPKPGGSPFSISDISAAYGG